jgi:N-acetylmuramoyl-L-alanine amidase
MRQGEIQTLRRGPGLSGLRRRLAPAVALVCLILAAAPAVLGQSALAERRRQASAQYERAEKLRAALEAKSAASRTLREYNDTVAAYRRVFLITPHAVEATAALNAIGLLYQQMGERFGGKHYQSAIDAYQFLIHEYPGSKHLEEALYTVGRIQLDKLEQLDAAELTFQDFRKRFPRSERAVEAARALGQIAAVRDERRREAATAEVARQQSAGRPAAMVRNVRHWNDTSYTRVVVDLEHEVQFQSARIAKPDRIYFDIYPARLSSTMRNVRMEVEGGFLKAIRAAQNQNGVVRIVLEVDAVKDYSVFLLPNPYRLVVDVYGEGTAPAQLLAQARPAGAAADAPAKPPVKQESPPAEQPAREETPAPAKTEVARANTSEAPATAPVVPPTVPQPLRNGNHSLTRAFGLKVGRIVIDPGHGGHDTGTIGPSGLMEKDLCLDLALRLGKAIQENLPGVEVVFTRTEDVYVALEERTALANRVKADMFLSIHANASRDRSARGIETYYLSFATSSDAMEVAARENALSQSSLHELQDLIRKIASNDKIEESRELATAIQTGLSSRMQRYSRYIKDRGVKRAPFVVLIGADMPSVLTEVSFLSNARDEAALRESEHRDRVVEGLYNGIESYLRSLNSMGSLAARQPAADVAPR